MKRVILAASILVIAAATLWSQPKVAVLDAIIPQNMDPSVVVPVTEKIVERLVVSGRFTVLDRANIESVLKEREFQVSGMVSDQDVVTAGKYLGADFVVVAKVQKVGDTYFISAKMINIKTGVIANQTSAQGEGKLSTLIDLAAQVGEVLSGGAVTAVSSTGGQNDISKPVEPQKEKKHRAASPMTSTNYIGVGGTYSLDVWDVKASDSLYQYTKSYSWDFGSGSLTYSGKYFQLGVGYVASLSGKYAWNNTWTGLSDSGKITATQSFLTFSGLLKYPIYLGSLTFFPLGGIEYDLNLSYKDSSGNDLKALLDSTGKDSLNLFFLQIGAGVEIKLGALILCPEVIYGWKIPSKADTDYESYLKSVGGWSAATVKETKFDLGLIVGFAL
jgi:TolB-like protein